MTSMPFSLGTTLRARQASPGAASIGVAAICAVAGVSTLLGWLYAEPFELVWLEITLAATIAACAAGVAASLVAYARAAAAARDQAAHEAEIEDRAKYDGVSGLHTFRYFREWLAARIDPDARASAPIALVMLDLDNFKEVNDRHGHDAGDELLAAIGRTISDRIDGDGLAARYGGDEFVIALPGRDHAAAAAVAESVRSAIGVASTRLSFNGHAPLNARFGIAVYPANANDAGSLVMHADRALYEVKAHEAGSDGRQRERNAQDVFFAIGEAMGRSLDPQDTLNNLVSAVGTTLVLDTCAIWTVHRDQLRPRAWFVGDVQVQETFERVQGAKPITRDEAVACGLLSDQAVYYDDSGAAPTIPERYRAIMPPGTWSIQVPLSGDRKGFLTMSARHERVAPPSLSLARAMTRLASAAIQNADVHGRARRHHAQLAKLSGIGGLLFEDGEFEEQLANVIDRIGEVMGCDMLTLDTDDPTGEKSFLRQFYVRAASNDTIDEELRELWMSMRPAINQGDEIDRFLSTVQEPIILDDPANQVPSIYRDVVGQSGTRTVAIVPANWQGEMKGLLYFASFKEHAYDEQDITLMQSIAAQLAPALQVAALRVEVAHSYGDLKAAHTQALLRLAYAAEARDPYTECHLTRIKAIAQAIARRMGIEDDALEAIGYGAIVHDLGKLRIPDSILCNPGTLSDDEWTTMKRHPEWGAEIIGGNAFYDVAREVAHCHHERWDGSGYPRGLAGEEIPLAARIVSVADVYDALTSARPYKNAWPVERALVELMRMRAKTLCPHAVDTFMQLWNEGEIGRIDDETLDESLEVDFRAMFAA
jgi:diguanylate cyclase (GGDEF)-like protein